MAQSASGAPQRRGPVTERPARPPRPRPDRRERAIVCLDRQGAVTSWDEGAERLFGVAAADAVGRDFGEVAVPDWLQDQWTDGFAQYVRGGPDAPRGSTWTLPVRAADGSPMAVEIDVLMPESTGSDGVVVLIRQFSSERVREDDLADLVARLFDRAPEIITILGPDGRQRAVNSAGLEILGYEPWMQWPPDGLWYVHPDDLSEVGRLRETTVDAPGPPLRFRVRDAAGTWRWLESVSVALVDEGGSEATVVFSRDVTQAEEDRRALAESRVEAELQAQALRRYDALRNDFVTALTHELRTPLTSLLSASELLATDEDLDPGLVATARLLRRNAERLGAIIEDLLLASRLDADMISLSPVPIDLAELLEDCVLGAATAAAARNVTVVLSCDTGPLLVADEHIRHAVDNVVGNAVKYTAPDTTVEVHARPEGGRWIVSVRDHGPGVPPPMRERIFERFVRGDGMDDSGVTGSGLGLAIARSVVQLHGGTIEVDDAPGGGAEFTIDVPSLSTGP